MIKYVRNATLYISNPFGSGISKSLLNILQLENISFYQFHHYLPITQTWLWLSCCYVVRSRLTFMMFSRKDAKDPVIGQSRVTTA